MRGGLRPWQLAGGGPGGGLPEGNLLGIGLLNRDPAVNGGAWQVVKGDDAATDPDTLRGESFFRIVADPAHKDQLVAATTKGVYVRPTGGDWVRVTAWAAGRDTGPLDVALTRQLSGALRIWVASASALHFAELDTAHSVPIDPAGVVFAPVALPSVATNPTPRVKNETTGGTRLALATDGSTVFVLGRQTTTGDRVDPPAALWRVDAGATAAALASPGAVLLAGTPEDLFMSAGDQSDYDMCIESHPSVAGRVYIGGATVGTGSGWNGAVYRCDTTSTDAHATYVGEGTHADIHVRESAR